MKTTLLLLALAITANAGTFEDQQRWLEQQRVRAEAEFQRQEAFRQQDRQRREADRQDDRMRKIERDMRDLEYRYERPYQRPTSRSRARAWLYPQEETK